ncbi:MAG TPA: hypothetical protein VK674_00865 [Candidatus Limnocylindria bacterium]|nr:hypothetical protein [Candidatus Limnocylindria bacterium]
MSKKDDDYTAALLEELRDQNRRILEAVTALIGVPDRLQTIESKIDGLHDDRVATKAAVKDQSRQVHNHERRITVLEST